MNYNVGFGQINIIANNIVEVVIKQGLEVSLEMIESYEKIIAKHITCDYGVLVNRINDYGYAYESLLCVGSTEHFKAAAVIFYAPETATQMQSRTVIERIDQLKVKQFSGLDLGRESAIAWLKQELSAENKPQCFHSSR